ncbi:unnamed protein product [Zymoseptoria tritici ST99CH_3D1]|nr:unnamed protein product [Zymoseptoria tritici ST99CH_3D1]
MAIEMNDNNNKAFFASLKDPTSMYLAAASFFESQLEDLATAKKSAADDELLGRANQDLDHTELQKGAIGDLLLMLVLYLCCKSLTTVMDSARCDDDTQQC